MENELIKLQVSTHSGDIDIVEVETYDADLIAEKLNSFDMQAIAIGDNVYSRIDIKNIKKIITEE